MDLIVAVDRHWGIGCKGHLLVHSKKDMAWFREQTRGKTLVYGSRTLSGFPRQEPLPHRRNIVLSRRPGYYVHGAETCSSLGALSRLLSAAELANTMVIGGADLYRQLLPYCRRALVTRFNGAFEADAFFPDLDADPAWQCHWADDWRYDADAGILYQFTTYIQTAVRPFNRVTD